MTSGDSVVCHMANDPRNQTRENLKLKYFTHTQVVNSEDRPATQHIKYVRLVKPPISNFKRFKDYRHTRNRDTTMAKKSGTRLRNLKYPTYIFAGFYFLCGK